MKSREQSLFAGLLQKQNRTQLAIILGVVAMLLILFSELFSTPAKTAANAGSSAAVSETAYREQLETQLTELIEQLDGAGKTVVMVTLESGEETIYGKWGRNDLCCGYAVRPDAEPGDPCSAGGWLRPGRDDLSACRLRCGCCL